MDSGWKEWSQHVLKELERLDKVTEDVKSDISKIRAETNTEFKDLRKSINDEFSPIKEDLKALNTTASMYAGLVSTVMFLILKYIFGA